MMAGWHATRLFPGSRANRTVRGVLALLTLAVLAGCDGAAGPDGANAPETDSVAPEIILAEPAANTPLRGSLLTLRAELADSSADDLVGIRYAINGQGSVGGDSAVVMDPPYAFAWDLALSDFVGDLLVINATSIDTAGNTYVTPGRLIRREQVVGLDSLDDLGARGSVDYMAVPITYDVFLPIEGSEDLDTVRYNYDRVAERFYPSGPARLLSAEVMLTERPFPGYADQASFWLTVHAVSDSVAPGEALDSIRVVPGVFGTDRWLAVDLTALNGGAGFTFDDINGFFLAVRPDVRNPVLRREGVNLRILIEPVVSDSARLERTWWWADPYLDPDWEPAWEPIAATSPVLEHLFIRAVVDYGDGTESVVPPGRLRPGAFDAQVHEGWLR